MVSEIFKVIFMSIGFLLVLSLLIGLLLGAVELIELFFESCRRAEEKRIVTIGDALAVQEKYVDKLDRLKDSLSVAILINYVEDGDISHCTLKRVSDGRIFNVDAKNFLYQDKLYVGDYYTCYWPETKFDEDCKAKGMKKYLYCPFEHMSGWYATSKFGMKKFKKDYKCFKKTYKKLTRFEKRYVNKKLYEAKRFSI